MTQDQQRFKQPPMSSFVKELYEKYGVTNNWDEAIRRQYVNAQAPKVLFVPISETKTKEEWDKFVEKYTSSDVGRLFTRKMFSVENYTGTPVKTDGDTTMPKQVLVKDNTRDEAFVTYKKVGNEIVVTKESNGDFTVNINSHSGDKGSTNSIRIPSEFGRLLGEALMKETETKTGCGVGQTFFDSPEFQQAWEKWVRRH